MEALVHLDLSCCSCISELPQSFCNLKNLEHMDFAECLCLTGVSECIGTLRKLQYLNLSYCRNIGDLPRALGSLTELHYLNLANSSYLHRLAEAEFLGSLTKLKYLNLSSDRLRVKMILPEALCSLTELRYLSLSGSDVTEFRRLFGNFRNLVHLDLSNCDLTPPELQQEGLSSLMGLSRLLPKPPINLVGDWLEDEWVSILGRISTLTNLEHLDLSGNRQPGRIPESLGNLRKLHTLNLSCCASLQSLPASLSGIDGLKFLDTSCCKNLDISTIPQNKKSLILIPQFVVHALDGESYSTLVQLENKNPPTLEISKLENVKSVEEAQRIKLVEKKMITDLEFVWTRYAKRFVDDREVLRELVPPDSVKRFKLEGYNSISFPPWMMGIAAYLPHLVFIKVWDLPNCNKLPPLGQLPNLKELQIGRIDNIRKIDRDLFGGPGGFPRLTIFSLLHMEFLEEWNTTCEDGSNEPVFQPRFPRGEPEDLNQYVICDTPLCLEIASCPKLMFQPRLPRGDYRLSVSSCDQVMMSSRGNRGHVCATSFAQVEELRVECCEAPLHQWNLLRQLPCLKDLSIKNCSDLTCSSPHDLLRRLSSMQTLKVEDCERIALLPDRLGDILSLKELEILNCKGIKTLPESIQQLTRLKRLKISACPQLVKWCETEENKMKLAHIQRIEIESNELESESHQE